MTPCTADMFQLDQQVLAEETGVPRENPQTWEEHENSQHVKKHPAYSAIHVQFSLVGSSQVKVFFNNTRTGFCGH